MYGILELSIAKAAIGWALMVGYMVHLGFLVKWFLVVRKWEALKKGMSGVGGVEWEGERCKRCSDCGTKHEHGEGDVEAQGDKEVEHLASRTFTAKKGFGVIGKGKGGVNTVTVVVKDVEEDEDGNDDERRTSNGPPKKTPYFPPPPTKPTR